MLRSDRDPSLLPSYSETKLNLISSRSPDLCDRFLFGPYSYSRIMNHFEIQNFSFCSPQGETFIKSWAAMLVT